VKVVLNLGSGSEHVPEEITLLDGGEAPVLIASWPKSEWQEIRVDLDDRVEPDYVADIRELPVEPDCVDAILLKSCLEHFPEHEVGTVLSECNRVLKIGGQLIIAVPDLQSIANVIAEDRLIEVIRQAPAGPVRAIDMLYGYSPYIPSAPLYAHRTGFTATTLLQWLERAGFEGRAVRDISQVWVWAVVTKVRTAVVEAAAMGTSSNLFGIMQAEGLVADDVCAGDPPSG
jgi:SAM-dependent methyltransferase